MIKVDERRRDVDVAIKLRSKLNNKGSQTREGNKRQESMEAVLS